MEPHPTDTVKKWPSVILRTFGYVCPNAFMNESKRSTYVKVKRGGGHLLKGACYWELVVIVVKTVTAFQYYSKTEAQISMMISTCRTSVEQLF